MGAFEGAWRTGKSSGEDERGLDRVSMGGALVNLTVFVVGVGQVSDRGVGVFSE